LDETGLKVFVPSYKAYTFDPGETASELLDEMAGAANMRKLQNLLFRNCFCFFASKQSVPKGSLKEKLGPVPPIRELIRMALGDEGSFRVTDRKLPALPPDVLYQLCQVAQVL